MQETAQSPLVAWETFFFLVGSSGAGLTGLQFVVIALISESRRRPTHREIEAYATPNILVPLEAFDSATSTIRVIVSRQQFNQEDLKACDALTFSLSVFLQSF